MVQWYCSYITCCHIFRLEPLSKGYDEMLQTLKTLLDERPVIWDIQIERNADAKIEDDSSVEDLGVITFGELVDNEAGVGSYGPSEEPDWSDTIEENDGKQTENAPKIEDDSSVEDLGVITFGELVDNEAGVGSYGPSEEPDWSGTIEESDGKQTDNAPTIDAYCGGDQEETVVEKIGMDHGDFNHYDELVESEGIRCRTSAKEETRC